MTPDEFKVRMKKVLEEHSGDNECQHSAADDLMEQALKEAGYGEGIEMMNSASMNWWWA